MADLSNMEDIALRKTEINSKLEKVCAVWNYCHYLKEKRHVVFFTFTGFSDSKLWSCIVTRPRQSHGIDHHSSVHISYSKDSNVLHKRIEPTSSLFQEIAPPTYSPPPQHILTRLFTWHSHSHPLIDAFKARVIGTMLGVKL